MHRAPTVLRQASKRLIATSSTGTHHQQAEQVIALQRALWGTETAPEWLSEPQLQLGPHGVLISPYGAPTSPTTAQTQQLLAEFLLADDQGKNYQGDKPAENPRNDVPPVGPEGRSDSVPPSPDATNQRVNDTDYSSPGTKTSPENSRNPAGGTTDGNNAGTANAAAPWATESMQPGPKVVFHDGTASGIDAQQEMAAWAGRTRSNMKAYLTGRMGGQPAGVPGDRLHIAPVEALLEVPLQAAGHGTVAAAGEQPTGITGVSEDPPEDKSNPQVIPDKESPEDTERIEKAKEEMKKRKDETGAPNQGIQSGDDKASGGGKHGEHV